MFCLFKNSHVRPGLNRFLILVSWVGALSWLYFAFYEKELLVKLLAGETILVDLLLGVPLVLMLAVVVYATLYWFLKLLVVYFLPHALIPAERPETYSDESSLETLESQYGEAYWQDEESKEQPKRPASNSEASRDTSLHD